MKFGDTFYFFFLRESMAVLSGCKCQKCLEDRNLLDIPVDTKDEKEATIHNCENFSRGDLLYGPIQGFSPVSQKNEILI